ncbi:MAG: thioredoxin domain-containing protein, partial [Clostridiales bacterium]|nr:thioredoxin domain-containing protein [Clostridiales bacterium]
ITENGNFEGKSIPNLLQNETADEEVESVLEKVYEYRKSRAGLRTDDKILTAWNSLMIAAMCAICRESGNTAYLEAAKKAQEFIEDKLCEGDTLFVSYRGGSRGERGFLDDYAFYIYALLALYGVTLEKKYLERATVLCRKTLSDFCDREQGGFYLYGENGEKLILRPKERYDGAIPGGNSVMAYNLVRLSHLDEDEELEKAARRQLDFLYSRAKDYPAGYAMFLLALSDYFDPPAVITVVPKNKENIDALILNAPENSILRVVNPGNEYRLKDGKTTFYVCRGHRCMPAENDLNKCSDDGNTFNK